ncbi:MAG: M13 family metallopeptidase [Bryobacteraceae bacterium]
MFKSAFLSLLGAAAMLAQTPAPTPAPPSPLEFGVANMDTSADPCVDFYQYACGTWLKKNPAPPDQARWGRFSELEERNRDVLHQILEEAAKPLPSRDSVTRQIGDYFAACMDEKAIDARGLKPIESEMARIRGLKNKSALAGEIAHLHGIGVGALFSFGSGQDFKDSDQVIAQADQGGLGMPDRDYYFKQDAKSIELRAKYVEHVGRMFELLGEPAAQAKADADTVMTIETAIAKGSLDLVSRRDPSKVYHKLGMAGVQALSPLFGWKEYLRASGSPEFQSINVASPDFFKAVNSAIRDFTLAQWKTYLTWQLVHSVARLLPTPFVQENFNYFGKTLSGTETLRPRWKRCVDYTDAELGEALGRKFVEKTFGEEGKARTLKMVAALEKAQGQDIDGLTWMTGPTKQKALEKLHAIANKIGYPDKWRDYSSVVIQLDDPAGNNFRADNFEFHRELNKIGKPVDRAEWEMTPPTVNAYYDALMNNINFPAGILQPPFFDNREDDAVNFGGIGMVIGHELTHGFDDQGRQFDPQGNLKDWWTPEDGKEFDSRVACIDQEYSKFEVAPGAHVNGKLTLGENTADNGGLRIALMALLNTIGDGRKKVDGFTPEQRLFLSFGQVWCENARPEILRMQVQTDPHSPAQFRVNGVVQNMPEFQKAFSCKADQPMISPNACHVW